MLNSEPPFGSYNCLRGHGFSNFDSTRSKYACTLISLIEAL